jgi:diaminopimelate epimerase
MPGGRIDVIIAPNYSLRMTGPVTRVASGILADI